MADKTEADIEIPDDYKDATLEEYNQLCDPLTWLIDLENYEPKTYVRGAWVYYLVDDNGLKFNWKNIAKTDAWLGACALVYKQYNEHMARCREAYLAAHICNKTNPQHTLETKTCGSTFKRCTRCGAVTEGEATHRFPGSVKDTSGHRCVCGAENQQHTMVRTQTNLANGTGYNVVDTCSVCGFSVIISTHLHDYVDCECDCGAKCPTCNGAHVWGSASASDCASCTCSGCTVYKRSNSISDHGGWRECQSGDEADNDHLDAKGAHCQCACGTFGHSARTSHDPSYLSKCSVELLKPGINTDVYHLVMDWKCNRCGHPHGTKEQHTWATKALRYENISPTVCRAYYECTKNCGAKPHEVDTNGHVRDESNHCKCENCKTYQFEHVYHTDACGNISCQHCGDYASEDEAHEHSGYESENESVHRCACGKVTGNHSKSTTVSYSPGYKITTTTCSGCDYLKEVREVCTHACGYTAEVELSRGGGSITYVKYCLECNFQVQRTVPTEPDGQHCTLDVHVQASSGCGCECGHFNSSNPSGKMSLHRWASTTDANGVRVCTCQCGHYHDKRSWPTAMTTGSTPRVCPNICAYAGCMKADTGKDVSNATIDDHTPTTASYHVCGCRCGRVNANTAADVKKFHHQMTGACICWGADTDNDGFGNGGTWHFRCSNGASCPKICTHLYQGRVHLASRGDVERTSDIQFPEVKDHEPKISGGCGCKCGVLCSTNYPAWYDVQKYHMNQSGTCRCYCDGDTSKTPKSKFHWPFPSANGCTNVCAGGCGGLCSDSYRGKTTRVTLEDHTPHGTLCGCECRAFTGDLCKNGDAEYMGRWHRGSSGTDLCGCGNAHLGRTQGTTCPDCCANASCNYKYTSLFSPFTLANHETQENACSCQCGKQSGHHKWDSQSCVCYCHEHRTRDHALGSDEEEVDPNTSPYTCETCGNLITKYRIFQQCTRTSCNAKVYKGAYEKGHNMTLHTGEGDADSYGIHACGNHPLIFHTVHAVNAPDPDNIPDMLSSADCHCLTSSQMIAKVNEFKANGKTLDEAIEAAYDYFNDFQGGYTMVCYQCIWEFSCWVQAQRGGGDNASGGSSGGGNGSDFDDI